MAKHGKPERARTTVRLVGTPKRVRKAHSAIDASFRHGTVRAAFTASASDRTLGSRAYRLTASASERAAHNAVNAKRNTADWTANPEPMAYVTAERRDSIGTEAVHPRSNIVRVPFEGRLDHLNRGARSLNW